MKGKLTNGRRDFLLKVVVGGAGLLVLGACSEHKNTAPSGGDDDCGNGASTDQADGVHVHTTIDLTAGEVAAATPGVYQLLAGAHTHTFNISGGNFTTLTTTGTVTINGDIEGHGHSVTITC